MSYLVALRFEFIRGYPAKLARDRPVAMRAETRLFAIVAERDVGQHDLAARLASRGGKARGLWHRLAHDFLQRLYISRAARREIALTAAIGLSERARSVGLAADRSEYDQR